MPIMVNVNLHTQKSCNTLLLIAIVIKCGECLVTNVHETRTLVRNATTAQKNVSSQTKLQIPQRRCKDNCTYLVNENVRKDLETVREDNDDADKQNNELPMSLIIASAVVAGFIIVFVCLLYCWHSHQLDARAQIMAFNQKATELSRVMVQQPTKTCDRNQDSDIDKVDRQLLRQSSSFDSKESRSLSQTESGEMSKQNRTQQSAFI